MAEAARSAVARRRPTPRAPVAPRTVPRLRFAVLAIEGCMLSNIAGTLDALRVAQKVATIQSPANAPRFDTAVLSARGPGPVLTSCGLEIAGFADSEADYDVVLVPGLMHASGKALDGRVADLTPELELLRRLHLRGVKLAAACSGVFVLARTGLLDGRRATTSWWLSACFRQRFPQVQLEADAILVEDGPLITSGAATAVMQMMLHLIAGVGGEALAQQTARLLMVDPERQSQAPYVNRALIEQPRHSLSERAEKFLQAELHREISVSRLAEHVGTSERSLLRHFKAHFGVSPQAHIQHLRVERAKALLEATHLSVDEIVERCGYSDVSSFRKLFKRATTLTPGNWRERFRLRAR